MVNKKKPYMQTVLLKIKMILLINLIIMVGTITISAGANSIVAIKTSEPIIINGKSQENSWETAPALTSYDQTTQIPITMKALYNQTAIYFLVSFPDPDESRTHKSWVWDKSRKMYEVGFDREDVFILKWNMETKPVDLSIYADTDHKADIWYWKACRTDPVGYADDKIHILTDTPSKNATRLVSRSGMTKFLTRKGDSGKNAFTISLTPDYTGDILNRYAYQLPTDSRADVQAKGHWENGRWVIEFARSLRTGYQDDIQFNPTQQFYFSFSRFEIAGRKPNPKLSQPSYGSGDTGSLITLIFQK